MSSGNLEDVKKILDEALDLPTAERSGFLARACAGDRSLKQEVESLLAQECGVLADVLRDAEVLGDHPRVSEFVVGDDVVARHGESLEVEGPAARDQELVRNGGDAGRVHAAAEADDEAVGPEPITHRGAEEA